MRHSKTRKQTAILDSIHSISVMNSGFDKACRTIYFLGKLWINRKAKSYI